MKTETTHAGDRPVASALSEAASQRQHGWPAVVAAALMIAVLLVATAAGFRFVQSDPLPVTSNGPVIAVEPGDGEWPAGEVFGTLRLEGGCLLIDDAVALFQAGATWSAPDQEVVFADGTRWALGQQINGGGGYYSPAASVTGTRLGDQATSAAVACADELGLAEVVLVAP